MWPRGPHKTNTQCPRASFLCKSVKYKLFWDIFSIWKSLGATQIILAGRIRPSKCLFEIPDIVEPSSDQRMNNYLFSPVFYCTLEQKQKYIFKNYLFCTIESSSLPLRYQRQDIVFSSTSTRTSDLSIDKLKTLSRLRLMRTYWAVNYGRLEGFMIGLQFDFNISP